MVSVQIGGSEASAADGSRGGVRPHGAGGLEQTLIVGGADRGGLQGDLGPARIRLAGAATFHAQAKMDDTIDDGGAGPTGQHLEAGNAPSSWIVVAEELVLGGGPGGALQVAIRANHPELSGKARSQRPKRSGGKKETRATEGTEDTEEFPLPILSVFSVFSVARPARRRISDSRSAGR